MFSCELLHFSIINIHLGELNLIPLLNKDFYKMPLFRTGTLFLLSDAIFVSLFYISLLLI